MWEMLWNLHRGKVIGTALGVFFGLVFLIVGFWKMLVFSLIVILGFYIGMKLDSKENLMDVVDRILPGKFIKK